METVALVIQTSSLVSCVLSVSAGVIGVLGFFGLLDQVMQALLFKPEEFIEPTLYVYFALLAFLDYLGLSSGYDAFTTYCPSVVL